MGARECAQEEAKRVGKTSSGDEDFFAELTSPTRAERGGITNRERPSGENLSGCGLAVLRMEVLILKTLSRKKSDNSEAVRVEDDTGGGTERLFNREKRSLEFLTRETEHASLSLDRREK